MPDSPFDPPVGDLPRWLPAGVPHEVQCPNCCRMAFVFEMRMGLLFYWCELCGTKGATPHDDAAE